MSNIMGDESPTAPGFISTELFQCQGLDAVITTFLLCGLCLAYFGRGNSRPFLGQRDKDRKVFASRASLEKAKKEKNIRLSNAFQSHDGHAIKKDMALTTPEMGQQSWSYPAPVDPSVDRDAHIVRIAKSGYPYDAHNMLRQSLEFGHQPKQGTFATVMHMYAKVGSIKQAMCVVHEMQSAEIQFDVTTYNLIMDAWLRAGDALAAQCWMRRMLDKGVRPNVISFGIIFRACATAGRFEDLEKWFTHAQQLGFDFSLASLDETVKVIARSGDAVNAMKWLRIAIDHGVQPSIRCFMAVLKAIDSKSDVELATDIIDMMRLGSVQPDGAFFSQCVVLAAQNGHHAKAQQWARDCVSAKGTLSKAAMLSLNDANLWRPELVGSRQVPSSPNGGSGGRADTATAFGGGAAHTDSGGSKNLDEIKEAAFKTCIGRTFTGVIKDFQPGRFGHIACAATYDLFQKDVFLGRNKNPLQFTKGQRVSFVLQIDEVRRSPMACDVALARP